jgi:hypothetical protein
VQDVKRILRHANFFAGPINGDPTSDYFQAVIDFQNSKHITVDGLVGGETLVKLKETWPEYFEQSKVTDHQLDQQGQARFGSKINRERLMPTLVRREI